MIAGMFGLVTGVYQKDAAFRERVVRYSAMLDRGARSC